MSDSIVTTTSPFSNSANQVGLDGLDAEGIRIAASAAGVATYRWRIAEDVLDWNSEASAVLQRPAELLMSGRRFASLLDPDNLTSRFDTIMNSVGQDGGQGVHYQIEYQLKADPETGLAPVWVEDTGKWFGDHDGRPLMACGVVRIITARHRRDQELSTLSHTDALTGLMNRSRLDEALANMLDATNAGKSFATFAVAAIQNLDTVNEAYGYEVADEVISAMAQRLRVVMRMGDGIGRYAGSKFGIILNSCSETDLPIALERLLSAARENVIETSKGPVWALLSIGAVVLPSMACTGVEARARAEESLSVALRRESDSFVIYQSSETITKDRMLNARCATAIVEGLRSEKFELAFQPMVSVATGDITCHEALLRMRDHAGELVDAIHLVPIAERLGLIRLIDRSVVRLAIETLHRYGDARLSVNVSATTANDPRWSSQILETIENSQIVADRLTVEITETTALNDLSSARAFLEHLRKLGCCVAIDDFGVGFTSFRGLRDLPIDVIKLDGSYCRDLTMGSENAYFARTLIEMAHHFGIRTVAEWVETASDAAVLTALGIDFLQGNHIGEVSVLPPWAASEVQSFSFAGEVNAAINNEYSKEAAVPATVHAVSEETPDMVIAPDAASTPQELEASDADTAVLLPMDEQATQPGGEPISLAEADLLHADMEDGLAKLREALQHLNGQYSAPQPQDSEERLAS
jgi:diguanylate cyclase (GGDEF)-like protein